MQLDVKMKYNYTVCPDLSLLTKLAQLFKASLFHSNLPSFCASPPHREQLLNRQKPLQVAWPGFAQCRILPLLAEVLQSCRTSGQLFQEKPSTSCVWEQNLKADHPKSKSTLPLVQTVAFQVSLLAALCRNTAHRILSPVMLDANSSPS